MKCPTCGTPGAYQGLNRIECENARCVHYVPPKTFPELDTHPSNNGPGALPKLSVAPANRTWQPPGYYQAAVALSYDPAVASVQRDILYHIVDMLSDAKLLDEIAAAPSGEKIDVEIGQYMGWLRKVTKP